MRAKTVENKMWRREENERGSARKIERVSARDFRKDVQDEVRKIEEIQKFGDTGERERGERERSETVIAKERGRKRGR